MVDQCVVKISYEKLCDSHTSFFEVTEAFAERAVRSEGYVRIVGQQQKVMLWIIVEWDSKAIFIGYHWQGGNSTPRARSGRESWFIAYDLVAAMRGAAIDCDHSSGNQILDQDQETILEVTRSCQSILDSCTTVTEDVKLAVEHALTGTALPPKDSMAW